MLYRLTRWACSTPPGTIVDADDWPAPGYASAFHKPSLMTALLNEGTLLPYEPAVELSPWCLHFGLLAEVEHFNAQYQARLATLDGVDAP